MSVVYLLGIPFVIIAWIYWANSSMTARDKRYEISTPSDYYQTATAIHRNEQVSSGDKVVITADPVPTNIVSSSYGYTIASTQVPVIPTAHFDFKNSATPNTVQSGTGGAGGSRPTLVGVDTFYDLHITLTALVADLTATPYRATALAQPLYNRVTGACILNCGFLTITPSSFNKPKH